MQIRETNLVHECDICVIGGGITAVMLVERLAALKPDLKITVLEAGRSIFDRENRGTYHRRAIEYGEHPWHDDYIEDQQARGMISMTMAVGGQALHWGGACNRFSEEDLRRKMPDIIGFSELGDFIDQPVKTYSTGMAMRLGFSIATQVEPDVLIIDEALSVGDGYFQKKCMDRLLRFVEGGGTLLFCSHAMYYVSSFCQRAVWMRNGRMEALGPAADVIREYENYLVAKNVAAASSEADADAEAEGGPSLRPARITSARLVNVPGPLYTHGQPWELEIEWESGDPSLGFHLGVGINRSDEVEVCSFATHLDGLAPRTGELRYSGRLRIPNLPLVKGEFTVYAFLLDSEGLHIYDQRRLARAFTVHSPTYAFGLIRVDHVWDLEARSGASSEVSSARA